MEDEEQLPFERPEEHAVAGVVALERVLLLYPRPLDAAGRGIGDTLGIPVLTPTRPQHSQFARLRPEQLRPVGHPPRHLAAEGGLADAVHLLRPRRLAGAKDR